MSFCVGAGVSIRTSREVTFSFLFREPKSRCKGPDNQAEEEGWGLLHLVSSTYMDTYFLSFQSGPHLLHSDKDPPEAPSREEIPVFWWGWPSCKSRVKKELTISLKLLAIFKGTDRFFFFFCLSGSLSFPLPGPSGELVQEDWPSSLKNNEHSGCFSSESGGCKPHSRAKTLLCYIEKEISSLSQ